MKLHRYVDHQRLHIVTKDVISLSISVLLLFRHYISHKITFGAPSSGGVLRSACGAFILILPLSLYVQSKVGLQHSETRLIPMQCHLVSYQRSYYAFLHILPSFFFVDLSNIRVLRLFHDSTAKEIHSCTSTPGQYCVVSFPFMDSSE